MKSLKLEKLKTSVYKNIVELIEDCLTVDDDPLQDIIDYLYCASNVFHWKYRWLFNKDGFLEIKLFFDFEEDCVSLIFKSVTGRPTDASWIQEGF